jgi:hypothetical protein
VKRILRISIITCVVLIGCAAGSALLISKYLPTLKEALQVKLSEVLGSHVKIRGAYFRLQPLPKIVLDGIEINTPGHCSPVVTADRMVVSFAITPLFDRRVDVLDLTLELPKVSASFLNDGFELPGQKGAKCATAMTASPVVASNSNTSPNPGVTSDASSSWEVTLDSIQIHDGKLTLATPSGVRDITISHASSSLRRDGTTLRFGSSEVVGQFNKLPFGLSAASINVDQSADGVQLIGASITLAGDKIQLDGTLNASGTQLKVRTSRLALGKKLTLLPSDLKLPALPISDGLITANIDLVIDSSGTLQVGGELAADRIKTQSKDFSVEGVRLSKLLIKSDNNGISEAATDVTVRQLRIATGKERYSSETVNGSVSYRAVPKKGKAFTGSLAVKTFQFQDDATNLSDVNAELSKIIGKIDRAGGAKVTALLTGSQLKLVAPGVTTQSVAGVSVPLEVLIPAAGGYSVAGPVSVRSASMTVSNRVLSSVGGTVNMLVSGPLKQFRSRNLDATVGGKRILANVDFSMTPTMYELKSAIFNVAPGSVTASFKIGRTNQRNAEATVSATNLSIENIIAIADIQTPKKPTGIIASFQCNAKALMNSLEESATGQGSIEFNDGGPGFDRLSRGIVQAIAAIPLVGASMKSNETQFLGSKQGLRADFTIGDASLRSNNIVLSEPRYTLKARGSVALSGALAAKANIIFLQRSFASFGLGFDRLEKLLGRAGKIEIPLLISGSVSEPKVSPDLVQLAKNNSGLPLVRSAFTATKDATEAIFNGVTGVFGPSKIKEDSNNAP